MDVLLHPIITTSNKLQTESYSAANLANSEGPEANYYQGQTLTSLFILQESFFQIHFMFVYSNYLTCF